MKTKQIKQELQTSDPAQLKTRLNELQRSLFMLRLGKKTSHTKDFSQFGKLRRDIARILTFMGRKS